MEPSLIVYPSEVPCARVLVMLHGLGSTILPFSTHLSTCANRSADTTIVCVTYGVSFTSFSSLADQLWGVLLLLGLNSNLIVFGYSMGGFLAQVFAKRYKHAVLGLVLACTGCATHGTLPLTIKGRVFELLTSVYRMDILNSRNSIMPRSWFLTADEISLMEANGPTIKCPAVERNAQMHAVLLYMNDSRKVSIQEALEPIKDLPTLILHGNKDSVLSIGGACAIHGVCTKSKMYIFKNAGHGILMKYRDEVSNILYGWINTTLKDHSTSSGDTTAEAAPTPQSQCHYNSNYSFALKTPSGTAVE